MYPISRLAKPAEWWARAGGLSFTDQQRPCHSSEVVLERELNLTHAGRGAPDLSKRRGRGGGRRILVAPVGIRIAPLHVVGSVEHLQAKLQRLSFGDAKVLDQREVDVEGPGARGGGCGAVTELARDDVVVSICAPFCAVVMVLSCQPPTT